MEDLLAAGSIDLHTTYFETVTAMALVLFAEERVDMVVLETGLGGRLDATNVVTPELAVITPVDFDHEAFLGKSLEVHRRRKGRHSEARRPGGFRAPASGTGRRARAPRRGVGHSGRSPGRLDRARAGNRCHATAASDSPARASCTSRCPLAGAHQVENAATAAIALARLGLPDRAIETGIAATLWPGRLERVSLHPEIILDGAHNPAGARALAAHIERFYSTRRVRLIFGAMRDKAIAEISGILFPLAAEVDRARRRPRRARFLRTPSAASPPIPISASPAPSRRRWRMVAGAAAIDNNDVVFITGSLFLVAEARAIIGGKP